MDDTQPNLFSSLFQWRPSEKKLSAENFLTESFVYCLQVNEVFRSFWLNKILGQNISGAELTITTRTSHLDDERASTIYPDIYIRGAFEDGKTFALVIEVKWGAPYDSAQIKKYDRLLRRVENPYLVFVSPNALDCRRASSDSPSLHSTFRAIHWETVHGDLSGCSESCSVTRELAEFMDRQGLSGQKPLSPDAITHFLASRDFLKGLRRYCEKLMHEFEWNFLPAIYQEFERQTVRDQYGRVAIVFKRSGWNGAITIGFLHSNHDHMVRFADGSEDSVDLMMRIECAPTAYGRDTVTAVIQDIAEKARLHGGVIRLGNGSDNRNKNTLFIAQRSLSEFLEGRDEGEQLIAMHAQIEGWARSLFQDGRLETALTAFDTDLS